MALLEQMKVALRVKNAQFDDEITSVINAARAELVRAGVSAERANDESDDLITSAIRTYVLATYSTDTKLTDGYQLSFESQKENLRKSAGYRDEAKV